MDDIAKEIVTAYEKGNKVLLCGNGGSAADAQHIAAELSGRFYFDRPPLSAEALHTNSSYMTAVANDYSFDEVFSRLIQAQGNPETFLLRCRRRAIQRILSTPLSRLTVEAW